MLDMIFATIAAITVTGSMVFGYLIMFAVLAGSFLLGLGYVLAPDFFKEWEQRISEPRNEINNQLRNAG